MMTSQQIQDGRHIVNVFFHHVSAGNEPISTKFGTRIRIFIPRMAINFDKNLTFYKSMMADGRHLENGFWQCRPINAKFGEEAASHANTSRSRDQNNSSVWRYL